MVCDCHSEFPTIYLPLWHFALFYCLAFAIVHVRCTTEWERTTKLSECISAYIFILLSPSLSLSFLISFIVQELEERERARAATDWGCEMFGREIRKSSPGALNFGLFGIRQSSCISPSSSLPLPLYLPFSLSELGACHTIGNIHTGLRFSGFECSKIAHTHTHETRKWGSKARHVTHAGTKYADGGVSRPLLLSSLLLPSIIHSVFTLFLISLFNLSQCATGGTLSGASRKSERCVQSVRQRERKGLRRDSEREREREREKPSAKVATTEHMN